MQSCEPDVNGWHGSQKAIHRHTHTHAQRDTQMHTHSLVNICTFVMLRPWLLAVLAVQTGVQNNWLIFYSCRTFCCFDFACNFALICLFFLRAECAMEGACCPYTILSSIMLGTSTQLSATSLTLYNIIIIVDFFWSLGTMQIASPRLDSSSMACFGLINSLNYATSARSLLAGLSSGLARGSRLP